MLGLSTDTFRTNKLVWRRADVSLPAYLRAVKRKKKKTKHSTAQHSITAQHNTSRHTSRHTANRARNAEDKAQRMWSASRPNKQQHGTRRRPHNSQARTC